jgi:hypothetical protein
MNCLIGSAFSLCPPSLISCLATAHSKHTTVIDWSHERKGDFPHLSRKEEIGCRGQMLVRNLRNLTCAMSFDRERIFDNWSLTTAPPHPNVAVDLRAQAGEGSGNHVQLDPLATFHPIMMSPGSDRTARPGGGIQLIKESKCGR